MLISTICILLFW